jgi:hypothetical protein
MPKMKAKPTRPRRSTLSNSKLAKELSAVKAEVRELRDKCQRLNRTLIRLVWPDKWDIEDVDDDELWAKGIKAPSFQKWIRSLRK